MVFSWQNTEEQVSRAGVVHEWQVYLGGGGYSAHCGIRAGVVIAYRLVIRLAGAVTSGAEQAVLPRITV